MSTERARQRTQNQYSGSPEWYTPPDLLARIQAFYGGDYYDPCPASHGRIRENGLMAAWQGRVYVNPPYGRLIKPWVTKFTTEPVRECLLLVPAYTDTQWFAPLFAYPICFVFGRLSFVRPDGSGDRAPHPSVLVYRGRRIRAFADAFSDLGPIVRTYQPRQDPRPQLWEVPA